ncbi:hypothetical protein LXA43DRAFT_1184327 [Ganoderma leucocontextum]|nr:hypothetical protein LXA43DRAFT_1184327 [Ganoderma leucocontextum]
MTVFKMDSETTSNTAVSSSPPSPAPGLAHTQYPTVNSVHRTAATMTTRLTPSSPKSSRRDDEFYCQDVVFLVDDVLFKVPRRPFEYDSEAFSATFTLPPVNGAYGVEGSSDDNPIKLEGVTEDEFRPLLWVMFRSGYGSSRTLTQTQWISVLRLSTMWFFKDLRERAVNELSKLVSTPAARIVLARKFNIPGWTEPALGALAQQEQPLSAQDLEALGWDTAAKLIQIRESVVFSGTCVCGCNYCSVAHGQIANPAAQQGGHAHQHQPLSPGTTRTGQLAVSAVRKRTDFSQQIRAVFGTALY